MGDIFLDVCEIFYSLQGEGPYVGTPSVFLRLGGCKPPYCPFCDTKYAWSEFRKYSLSKLINEIKNYRCKNIVITGGEPFIQWNAGLDKLVGHLTSFCSFIQFETSGKVEIPEGIPGKIVCSPKYLEGKWQFVENNFSRCDYFKFIADKGNLSIILQFIKQNQIPKQKIYIMPFGTTREQQLDIMPFVFKFCMRYGFKMSPRLHILCFGNKRGI